MKWRFCLKTLKIFFIILLIIILMLGLLLSYIYYTECKRRAWENKVVCAAEIFLDNTFHIYSNKNDLIKTFHLQYQGNKYDNLGYKDDSHKIPIEIWEGSLNKNNHTQIGYEFNKNKVWGLSYYLYGVKNQEHERILQLFKNNLALFYTWDDENFKFWQVGDPVIDGIAIYIVAVTENISIQYSKAYKLGIFFGYRYKPRI